MSAFSRTTRSLDADHFGRVLLALSAGALLLLGWTAWLLLARVSVYERAATLQVGPRQGDAPPRFAAVALFPPAALGRIRPGQPAIVRLDGFPWTQYGSLSATVAAVDDARSGQLRVDLLIQDDPGSAIPLQPGLRGAVEIEVERVTPATLLLRTTGQALAPPADATAGPSGGTRP